MLEPNRELSLQSALIDALLAFSLVFAMKISPLISFVFSFVTRIHLGPSLINVLCCLASVSFGVRAANKLTTRQMAQKAALE